MVCAAQASKVNVLQEELTALRADLRKLLPLFSGLKSWLMEELTGRLDLLASTADQHLQRVQVSDIQRCERCDCSLGLHERSTQLRWL